MFQKANPTCNVPGSFASVSPKLLINFRAMLIRVALLVSCPLAHAPGVSSRFGKCTISVLRALVVLSAALKAALRLFRATQSQHCCHLNPEAGALVQAQQDRQLLFKRLRISPVSGCYSLGNTSPFQLRICPFVLCMGQFVFNFCFWKETVKTKFTLKKLRETALCPFLTIPFHEAGRVLETAVIFYLHFGFVLLLHFLSFR